jgi:putative addiction module component (TIGR02574 family)
MLFDRYGATFMSEKELSIAALKLPPKRRAKLADQLLASLESDASETIDEAWAKEVEARIDAFDAGKIRSRSVVAALRSLKRRAKR